MWRPFNPVRSAVINEEVVEQLEARTIIEVHYPEWLVNDVLVKKTHAKWQVWIDFTDLNKACLKDCFLLPRIDPLVDATAGHEIISFMDAYSCYNQIMMAEEDREKTAFTINSGLYCYRRMPFGLKNAGETYQRLMNKMFAALIDNMMKIYCNALKKERKKKK